MRHPLASIERRTPLPNVWDLLVVVLAVGVCVALADGARDAIHELRDVTLQNRIGVSPMCQYSSENGFCIRLALRASR